MTSDFTEPYSHYNYYVNLPSEMITFGKYRLTYEPPEDGIETHIDMSISSEADVDQMLEFFKSFMMAAGYSSISPLDEIVIENPKEKEDIVSPWFYQFEHEHYHPGDLDPVFPVKGSDTINFSGWDGK